MAEARVVSIKRRLNEWGAAPDVRPLSTASSHHAVAADLIQRQSAALGSQSPRAWDTISGTKPSAGNLCLTSRLLRLRGTPHETYRSDLRCTYSFTCNDHIRFCQIGYGSVERGGRLPDPDQGRPWARSWSPRTRVLLAGRYHADQRVSLAFPARTEISCPETRPFRRRLASARLVATYCAPLSRSGLTP
jgi:hypothetical protein